MITRYELNGMTGGTASTSITTTAPTLLQPIREDFQSTSGVGQLRIGAQHSQYTTYSANKLYPGAWVNGDIWLPIAGDWTIYLWSLQELTGPEFSYTIPYLALANPDKHMLAAAQTGMGAGRAAYHAETLDTTWNQIQKLEQRLIVRQDMTLSARGGDLRYRWNGPPQGGVNPNDISYDLLKDGEHIKLGPCPLGSLWARADKTFINVEANLISERLR